MVWTRYRKSMEGLKRGHDIGRLEEKQIQAAIGPGRATEFSQSADSDARVDAHLVLNRNFKHKSFKSAA